MNSFIQRLYLSFLNNAKNDCLTIDSETFSYGEVFKIVQSIREQISNINTQNIGIYLTDDVYMYASIFAIWFEGKTYVPIHADFPIKKNLKIIEQADIQSILTSKKTPKDFNTTIIDTTKVITSIDIETPPKEVSIETNAYILFTSGSTGTPKGVPITFENLKYFSLSFENEFGSVKTSDKVLQMFELTFDLSVMSFLIPLLNGACIVGLHKEETKYLQILDLLEDNQISIALMVPSILNLINPYIDPEVKNNSLRLSLFCGEPLLLKQIKMWKTLVPEAMIFNVYGPTENTIFCTAYKVEENPKQKNGIISIGHTMQHSQMSFPEKNKTEGELLLSGKLLTKHYWKNPEKSKEMFFGKENITYYKTGDYCSKDKDGDFFYENRIDFQAKINGFRIELNEIEYFANSILDNAISIAIIHSDEQHNDELILFINDTQCDEKKITTHLKEHLQDYAIPSRIIKIETYPVNTSGKIDRKALKELL